LRYIKLIAMIFTVFVCAVMLSSCEISTTLNIDEKFSGNREMVCTIEKSELNSEYVFGTIDEIETELRNYLPDALTLERKATITGGYRFVFNLKFSSYNEYVQKVTALLGREPSITYSQKDDLFCSGIVLKEDFTSGDLLNWAVKAMKSSGICPRIEYGDVDYTSTKVNINGEEVENKDTSNKKVNIVKQQLLPINKISIETEKPDFDTFKRTITFHFPERLLEKTDKKEFESYMESLNYKDCEAEIEYSVESEDSEETEIIAVYSFTTEGNKLCEYTNAILKGADGASVYEFDPDSLTPFSGEWGLSEEIDLSNWCNLYGYSLCPVSIWAKTEDGSRFSKSIATYGIASISGEIKNNGRVTQYAEMKSDKIKLKLTGNYDFSLESVKISVAENSRNNFTKTVSLVYKTEEDSTFGPQYTMDYYELKGIDSAEFKADVTEDGFGRLVMEFYGSAEKISRKTEEIFGEGNLMVQNFNEESKFTLTLENSITDKNDLSRFLREAGYEGKLTYVFRPYQGNRVSNAVMENSDGEIFDVSDELTSTGKINAELDEYTFSCGYVSVADNVWLIVVFAVSAVILALGLIAIIYFDRRSKKKKSEF